MTKEKENKKASTELQKQGTGMLETPTPCRFMKTFAEDMERLFDASAQERNTQPAT